MAESASPVWIGLLTAGTTIVGFLSSQILEWLKDRRAHERERESRLEARQDRVLERRNEEQRTTLLALQDAVYQLMQATGTAHSQDQRLHPQKGATWQQDFRSPELEVVYGEAQSKTAVLFVRVLDDEVRTMVQTMKVDCTLVNTAKNREQSDTAMVRALGWFLKINTRIGELVRNADNVFLVK